MPITQIPFQDPVAPAEKPQPEQLGLYDARGWETAYRELEDRVPHLLIQLQDDLARSRKREALWISIIFHLVLIIALWNLNLIQRYIPWHRAVPVAVNPMKNRDVTFLTLPPDAQKVPHKPNTNVLSDKDRIATSRHPELDPKELRKLLASPPPGAPGMRGPKAPPMAAQPPAMAQNQPPIQQQPQQAQPQGGIRPQIENNQTAQLQIPPRPNNNSVFSKYAAGMSAGSAIQQATQAAAANRVGGGGQGGDYGMGLPAHGRVMGPAEILSDTQGVDFGPYIQRIIHDVYENWILAMPESVQMGKKGKLAIQFAITKDGNVAGMQLVATSGDGSLDRAAWTGISSSNPFPPLPSEFNGPYLELRFRFYYNPDKADLE